MDGLNTPGGNPLVTYQDSTGQDPPPLDAYGLLRSDTILWPLFVAYVDSLRDFGQQVKRLAENSENATVKACLVRDRSDIAAAILSGYVPVYPEFLDHLRTLREALESRQDSPEISTLRSKAIELERHWDELLRPAPAATAIGNGHKTSSNGLPKNAWVMSGADLYAVNAELGTTPFFIEDFLPCFSLGVLVGEWGQGKTPYLYQMALCLASGTPFLGKRVIEPVRVLYVDFESSIATQTGYLSSLSAFLGLSGVPDNLKLINPNRPGAGRFTRDDLWQAVKEDRPKIVIIDALKYLAEDWGSSMRETAAVHTELRLQAANHGCMLIFVHHPTKPQQDGKGGRFRTDIRNDATWKNLLHDASGSGEIANGSDWRVAFVEETQASGDKVVLTRGFLRGLGETPLEQTKRVFDDEDKAIGYELIKGLDQLSGHDRLIYVTLPLGVLTTGQILDAWKKAGPSTNLFIKRLVKAGLVVGKGRGKWLNVGPQGESSVQTVQRA